MIGEVITHIYQIKTFPIPSMVQCSSIASNEPFLHILNDRDLACNVPYIHIFLIVHNWTFSELFILIQIVKDYTCLSWKLPNLSNMVLG